MLANNGILKSFAGRICFCRENWLSPVIQATWEAIELWDGLNWNGSYHQTEGNLWSHYGPPAKERSTEEVVVSYDENRQDCMLHQQSPEFEPQPDIKISVRPSSQYCNCTKNVINPNKKNKKKRV